MLLPKLTRDAILQLSDYRSYERGVIYYREGRVGKIAEDKRGISAPVHGTRKYKVKLWEVGDELNYSCTCPFGDEGNFCKHCVATGLKWLAPLSSRGESEIGPKEGAHVSHKDVKTYLNGLPKEQLVNMIMEEMKENDRFNQRLLLNVAKQNSNGINVRAFRALMKDAIEVDDFVNYSSMYDYATRIDELIDSIETFLKKGFAQEVIELSEYGLSLLDESAGMVDDSGGGLSLASENLQELHFKACKAAKPDPEALARRLFSFELNSQMEIFYGAVKQYAKILGKTGISVYRNLADKAWAGVAPLKPGNERESGKRFRITSIMEALARLTGNIEELVAVKSRDLSYAYSFLEIANIYKQAGLREKALEWAEKGVKAFPERTDFRLREFLAQEYHRDKKYDEEMKLIWANFCDSPSLASYQELKKHANRLHQWNEWREKALNHIRERSAGKNRNNDSSVWGWHVMRDNSLLVEIFIWEKNMDLAWEEALKGGCNNGLWLRLAEIRSKDHPEDAISIYKKEVGRLADVKTNQAYEEAVDFIKEIRQLFNRIEKEDEFHRYVETLKIEQKRKRNFIKLLEGIKPKS